ncbi:hypothetical protein HZI73_20365 [Vallitalea pronyensis]|uniref:Uncharacterized protein n=1 Tax=Vallitalea pronyensis TaxID=1348613 RepID=A0A8J8MMZ8_9FIRM|nr:hypothetical protein [Vallitalea pronyensis]QUI24511.1 hypothetical protein HZI73_20365 [Vallitalea pronyensis]
MMEDMMKGLILGLPFLMYGVWGIRKQAKKYFRNNAYKSMDRLIFFLLKTPFSWLSVIIGLLFILLGLLSL